MSGMFKEKKVEPQMYGTGDDNPQAKRMNELWAMIKPSVETYTKDYLGTTYPGELTAGLTDMEKGNLGRLNEYLSSPYASQSSTWGTAKNELEGIFGSKYDPWAADGDLAYTQKQLKRYLTEDLLPTTRHGAAATGGLYSSGLVRSESQNVADVQDKMTKYAYDMEKYMQGQRQAAIPLAMQMSEYETQEPLKRLADTMGLAGYERTQVTQPELTAKYQDYQSMLQAYLQTLGIAQGVATTQVGALGYPSYQPSFASQYVMPLVSSGIQAGGMMGAAAMMPAAPAAATAAASDRRIKEDIEETGDTYKGLKVYTWKWKKWVSSKIKQFPTFGLMAQEVREMFPEAVQADANGILRINYNLI